MLAYIYHGPNGHEKNGILGKPLRTNEVQLLLYEMVDEVAAELGSMFKGVKK